MKIALDFGHNHDAQGAFREVECIDLVGNQLKQMFVNAGHSVVLTRPATGNGIDSRYKKANSEQCDYFISIHFNAANKQARGTEVLAYDNTTANKMNAARIAENISKLGTPNRGVKFRTDLGVLNGTNMPAILVECMFSDNDQDYQLAKDNYIQIAQAIFEGFTGKSITLDTQNKNNASSVDKITIGTHVEVVGWVQKGKFDLLINGINYGERKASIERPDVVNVMGYPSSLVGFIFGISLSDLKKGNNIIDIGDNAYTIFIN